MGKSTGARTLPLKGLASLVILIIFSIYHPLLALLVVLATALISSARENYGVLEASGIPVVKPTLFLGSEPNLHKTVLHFADIQRFKEFGGIWGSYVGRTPQVFIADPELIRLIWVKDFVHFGDRQQVDFGSPMINEATDFLPGEKWRTIRNYLSPLFTTSKLKQMGEVMEASAAEFMEDLRAECDQSGRLKIDTRFRLTTWLVDMFAQAMLGLKMSDRKNPNNQFTSAFRACMGEDDEYNLLYTLSLSFPILSKLAPAYDGTPFKHIEPVFRGAIADRKTSGVKNGKDFLDVLVELWDRVPTKEFQELEITETTVLAQGFALFVGGYDTSGTTLSHLLYYMAENPHVQERMHSELMKALEKHDGEISKKLTVNSEIPYILACINEALRLAPPLTRPERICNKDWTHSGITIKKGMVVMLASWAANRNPQVYPNFPDEFRPERFLPENKGKLEPYAFTSFGFGPRNCVGTRFAYEEMKLFVCHLVKNFRVELRADTRLKYKPGSSQMVSFKPLYLDLVLRK